MSGFPDFVRIPPDDPIGNGNIGIICEEFNPMTEVDETARAHKLVGTKRITVPKGAERFRLSGSDASAHDSVIHASMFDAGNRSIIPASATHSPHSKVFCPCWANPISGRHGDGAGVQKGIFVAEIVTMLALAGRGVRLLRKRAGKNIPLQIFSATTKNVSIWVHMNESNTRVTQPPCIGG
jgi:hypothetical protein